MNHRVVLFFSDVMSYRLMVLNFWFGANMKGCVVNI